MRRRWGRPPALPRRDAGGKRIVAIAALVGVAFVVIVGVEPQRAYPNSRFAAHLLGYVREANEEQLKQGRFRRGDMVGQSGLERLLDEFLRGRDGGERIEVDAMGRPMRLIQKSEPQP